MVLSFNIHPLSTNCSVASGSTNQPHNRNNLMV